MGKFLAYFRARVLLANMSKKGNNLTVIPRIAKQRNMYRTYTYGILLNYTVKIINKRLPYFGATELHPIWVNVNPGICEPG